MYFPKLIERFTLGRVVYELCKETGPEFNTRINIGHVVGFDLNSSNEVIVKVLFADAQNEPRDYRSFRIGDPPTPRLIHPNNLEIA